MICVPIPGDSRKVTWYISWILPTRRGNAQKNEFPVEWTGSSGGEEAVRLKAVISVVNHDRMKACHARKVPAWCKRKLLGGPEQVYCLCRKKDDGKLMVQCNECKEWFHDKCVGVTARQAKR